MNRLKPMTLTQKILYHHAIGWAKPGVQAGDVLRLRVDWTLASELAWNGMNATYDQLGRPPISDPHRFYLALDHTVDPITLANDGRTQALVKLSRNFAKEAGLKHFYDANETIMHTEFYRKLVEPGQVVLGADSHTSSHGGMSAFAIGLGGADVAIAMVYGQTWLQVPEAIAIHYCGEMPFGISGKDIILKTLGDLGRNTCAMERSVEYHVQNADLFSADTRFTIANMTAEFGGLNGIFIADAKTQQALESRDPDYQRDALFFKPDADAPYIESHRIDLEGLAPQVAQPFSPDNVTTVDRHAGHNLDGVFIGACTTTQEELILAALVLELGLREGATLALGKPRKVVPGSREIVENLRRMGLLSVYERAGFIIGPPGCSMCLGIASDRAAEGETWLSSQNRNFPNRMGKGSIAWLASAATVAASSFSMAISDPRRLLGRIDQDRYNRLAGRPDAARNVVYEAPTPATMATSGGVMEKSEPGAFRKNSDALIQKFGDNIDTDAMIAGEFCHLPRQGIGDYAFRHFKPEFGDEIDAGKTVIVAGPGWGTGSSREHAVWALKDAGVEAVIAPSFAFIHKRNLVNEALPFLIVEDPKFYQLATDGERIIINWQNLRIALPELQKSFQAEPLAPIMKNIQKAGGIVAAIQRHGDLVFDHIMAAD